MQQAALDVIERDPPRILYINYGETDEWAHARRYDRYLEAARRVDRWLRELWETLQSIEQYRGTTTLIVTTDHGRGIEAKDWTSHGAEVPRSGEWWIAVMGPDTRPLGERKNCGSVTQAQTASTLAAFLGEDFRTAELKAAPPISDVLPK
ncbi:MAG: alkaline phosphatase family protein [Chthoniobacteraceae bacterium]